MKVTVFTDGSSRGNPGSGGWGAIVIYEDRVEELGGREDNTTNNRMELMAVIEALRTISDTSEIIINSDSEYVVKGITLWIHGWIKRNWKTFAKKPVLNQDLWEKLLEVTKDKNIKWQVVAGHSGNALNERCDEIATSFADNAPLDIYNGPISNYPLNLSIL